ncbi:MAG: GC-type dockerin domain-anchored protein [bacterium]
MIRTRLQLFSLVLCSALACLAPAVRGQPAVFSEITDSITPPAAPPSTQEYVGIPSDFLSIFNGDVVMVNWLKINVATPVTGDLFLDIDTRIYTDIGSVPGDLFMALYDAAGNLVATDDTDGGFPVGLAAGLSFGSTAFRTPANTPALAGQDGDLAPGEYWLAVIAGSASQVTASPTGWNASTTTSYQLGFSPDTYNVEFSISIGNTTPLDPPSNDDCANPVVIGENGPSGEPVWSGSNAGATNDGLFPCSIPEAPAALQPKTIWFNYIPTQTGFAEVVARSGAGSGVDPMLARYPGGCGSFPSQCNEGGSFDFAGDYNTRLMFPTVQGEPVLLALAVWAGDVGPMTLDVRLLPPPCMLSVPVGAIAESEPCGGSSNEGCSVFPDGAFEAIAPGQTVLGTLFNGTESRDVDHFKFTIPTHSDVTVSYQSQYPSFVIVFALGPTPSECLGQPVLWLENPGFSDICKINTHPGSLQLQPGTYRMIIGNLDFDGFGCGAGYEQYWLSLSAQAVPPEPPVLVPCGRSDIAGPGQSVGFDGELTADDIIVYLNGFFAGDPIADVAGPGQSATPDRQFTADDIIVFLNRFFAGC